MAVGANIVSCLGLASRPQHTFVVEISTDPASHRLSPSQGTTSILLRLVVEICTVQIKSLTERGLIRDSEQHRQDETP